MRCQVQAGIHGPYALGGPRLTFKSIIQKPVCPVVYPVSVSLIFTKNSAKMQFSLVVGGTSEKNVLISRFDL